MKKIKYILFAFGLLVLIAVVLMMVGQDKKKSIAIKTFDVNDYQYYVDNFSTEESLGSISDVEDAITKAEIMWIKMYGKRVRKERPYQAFYDEKNRIWLIRGSLQSNNMGGVANILIEDNTGKVLAVWHEK